MEASSLENFALDPPEYHKENLNALARPVYLSPALWCKLSSLFYAMDLYLPCSGAVLKSTSSYQKIQFRSQSGAIPTNLCHTYTIYMHVMQYFGFRVKNFVRGFLNFIY